MGREPARKAWHTSVCAFPHPAKKWKITQETCSAEDISHGIGPCRNTVGQMPGKETLPQQATRLRATLVACFSVAEVAPLRESLRREIHNAGNVDLTACTLMCASRKPRHCRDWSRVDQHLSIGSTYVLESLHRCHTVVAETATCHTKSPLKARPLRPIGLRCRPLTNSLLERLRTVPIRTKPHTAQLRPYLSKIYCYCWIILFFIVQMDFTGHIDYLHFCRAAETKPFPVHRLQTCKYHNSPWASDIAADFL